MYQFPLVPVTSTFSPLAARAITLPSVDAEARTFTEDTFTV